MGIDYQPPDFVVNALQHTTVQCSWDEGEKDRERKLTNISQWRQLQESELLQYVASSDSDDEENDEDDEEEDNEDSDIDVNKGRSKSSEASGQKKKRYFTNCDHEILPFVYNLSVYKHFFDLLTLVLRT